MHDEPKLLAFRKQKDKAWKEDAQSPLSEEQKKKFQNLPYFPPNPDLSFELELNKNIPEVGKKVIVKTTGGDEQEYLRAGKVNLTVAGTNVEAIVFEDPEQEQFQYYLLFRDQTTGKETYKNGRMLQVPKKGDKLIIDFNYAYNPYSSYNDYWDCPITPKENVLPVIIRAGEKKFR